MKNIKGHLRCTKVDEVLERITSDAIREYYEIQEKIDEERKKGFVTSSILACEWVDKYCINPYEVNDGSISFLLTGRSAAKVIYIFDDNFSIMDIRVEKR